MQIRKLGIVLRPNSPEIKEDLAKLTDLLRKNQITPLLQPEEMIRADAIMTLGGDGTFLGAIRQYLDLDKPFIGIHLGRLGFLAETKFDDIEAVVKQMVKGGLNLKERMVINAEIVNGGQIIDVNAVNELVIKGSKATSFINLKLFVDDNYVNSYLGDGLIVATPTGSTAYNLSASGPIVYPFSENFIFTPICSHSLSQRSLILPADIENIEVRYEEEEPIVVVVDGQKEVELSKRGKVIVRKREVGVKVLCRSNTDFFKVLKSKLNWGDDR